MRGWMPPYPETSGYIIPTLLLLGRETATLPARTEMARKIADWLIEIQRPDGGFLGGEVGASDQPDVFDTGMIVLGLAALAQATGDARLLDAAAKASEFLLSAMDGDGAFVRHIDNAILHTYNVRAAWGLMATGKLRGEARFIEGAERNARWTLAQQNDAGYFANNAFKKGGNANTHGTAYVMRGLLQIHELSGDRDYLAAVVRAADALQARYREQGWIAAEIGPRWQYLSSHICLTGYAQLAIIFYRLFQQTGDAGYRETADRLLADVGRTQFLGDETKPYCGAIAGSLPIYGRYAPLQYPNWATKFFLDAHLTKRQCARGQTQLPFQLYGG